MFFAALFTMAKMRTQPKSPSIDGWVDKEHVFVHAVEYYFSFKKKDMLQWERKWMNLENIMLSEVSQVTKRQTPLL